MAQNLSTPVAALDQLALDEVVGVRTWLAIHPSLSDIAALLLARDLDGVVRGELALNPQIALAAVSVLLWDELSGVRRVAAQHPAIPQ